MRSTLVALILLTAPLVGRTEIRDDYGATGQRAASGTTPIARRIMLIGDSVQLGASLRNPANQAAWRLERFGRVLVSNFSSPGATMADAPLAGMTHATSAVDLLSGFFGLYGLIVNLGNNDWGVSGVTVASFSAAYGTFLDSLPRRIRVACMSPVWSKQEGVVNQLGNTKDDFRAATRSVCLAHGAAYLEGKDAIPNDPAYFLDGVHPNDRGHRAMGAFLLRELRTLGWIR